MQTVNVAVMGHGVVGSGVVEVLLSHDNSIAVKAKSNINVKYILDLRDFPGDPNEDKMIKDFNIILNDDDVKVVVETMAGFTLHMNLFHLALRQAKALLLQTKSLLRQRAVSFCSLRLKIM